MLRWDIGNAGYFIHLGSTTCYDGYIYYRTLSIFMTLVPKQCNFVVNRMS